MKDTAYQETKVVSNIAKCYIYLAILFILHEHKKELSMMYWIYHKFGNFNGNRNFKAS